eukprot:638025_1
MIDFNEFLYAYTSSFPFQIKSGHKSPPILCVGNFGFTSYSKSVAVNVEGEMHPNISFSSSAASVKKESAFLHPHAINNASASISSTSDFASSSSPFLFADTWPFNRTSESQKRCLNVLKAVQFINTMDCPLLIL